MVKSIKNYSDNGLFGNIKVIEGELMPMRQQTMELIINSKTTLTITRISKTDSEMPLDYVVQTGGGLDLNALKNKFADDGESDAGDNSADAAKSGNAAVNLLKSFF